MQLDKIEGKKLFRMVNRLLVEDEHGKCKLTKSLSPEEWDAVENKFGKIKDVARTRRIDHYLSCLDRDDLDFYYKYHKGKTAKEETGKFRFRIKEPEPWEKEMLCDSQPCDLKIKGERKELK